VFLSSMNLLQSRHSQHSRHSTPHPAKNALRCGDRPVFCCALQKLVAVSSALFLSLSSSPLSAAAAESLTPYQRGLNLPYGLEMGRIRRCDAGAQPNCVSTSNGARPQLYMPPFLARGANARAAMDELELALRGMYPGEKDVVLVDERVVDDASKGGLYRRWAVPSALVTRDYVEVYINDDLEVFYRSQGSATKYVWPIQQPVSDLDAQKKRMTRLLREELRWKLIGGSCDVVECFDF
jgi:hypothetical protein